MSSPCSCKVGTWPCTMDMRQVRFSRWGLQCVREQQHVVGGVNPVLAKMPKSGCGRLCQDLLNVGNVSNIRSRAGMWAMLLFHGQERTG